MKGAAEGSVGLHHPAACGSLAGSVQESVCLSTGAYFKYLNLAGGSTFTTQAAPPPESQPCLGATRGVPAGHVCGGPGHCGQQRSVREVRSGLLYFNLLSNISVLSQ